MHNIYKNYRVRNLVHKHENIDSEFDVVPENDPLQSISNQLNRLKRVNDNDNESV